MTSSATKPDVFGSVVLSNGDLAVLAGNYIKPGAASPSYYGFDELQVAILSNSTPVELTQSGSTNLSFSANGDPDGPPVASGALYVGGEIAAIPGGGIAILTFGASDLSYDLQVLTNSLATTKAEFSVATQSGGDNQNGASDNDLSALAAWSGGIVVAYTTDGANNLYFQRFTTSGAVNGGAVQVLNHPTDGVGITMSMAVDSSGNVILGIDPQSGGNDTYAMYNTSNTEIQSGTVANSNNQGLGVQFVPLSGGEFATAGYTSAGLNVQQISPTTGASTAVVVRAGSDAGDQTRWISATATPGVFAFAEVGNTTTYDTYNFTTSTFTTGLAQPTNPGFDAPYAMPSPNLSGSGVAGVGVNSSNDLVALGLAAPPPAAPTITGITPDNGPSSTDGTTDTGALTVDGTAPDSATIDVYNGSTLIATGTANGSGNWTATLGTALAAGNYTLTATDTVSSVTSSASSGFPVDVDETAPTVSSIDRVGGNPNNANSDQFTVTFSEAVSGVSSSSFSTATTGTISGSVTGVTGTGTSYTVTVGSVTGNGTLGLNLKAAGSNGIQDDAGNEPAAYSAGQTYTIEHTPPSVTSIDTVQASSNTGGTEQFTVAFSESVTGVDTSDFSLAETGTFSAGSISSVSGSSGSSITVTVTSVAGTGTLGLNLKGSGTGITDAAGNAISGGFTSGETYSIAPAAANTFNAHVYFDTNADSSQDDGETGLSGVTVNLLDGSGNATGKSATTDASGNVSFTSLTDGSYEIAVVTPAGDAVSQATNLGTPNSLSAGQTASATEGVYAPPALTLATIDLTDAEGQSLGNLWTTLIANGIDPVPASLTITAVGTSGTQGLVSLNSGTDTLTYLATGFNPSEPVDSFTYTLKDGSGGTVTGTVDVTITGPTLPTTVVTTPGATGTATGSGQRLISEGTGQTLMGSPAGGDELFGGPDTTIDAAGNNNAIYAEPGNHAINMGASNNTATLGDGNNSITATGTGNTVTAGNGNNIVSGMSGGATITLGNGNDTVTISGANNKVTVGTGTDHVTITGTGGNDTIIAGDGTNTISAGGANDSFTVGNGKNTISAAGASATVVGGNGGDTVAASAAGDNITTGSGNDTIIVTAGSATIKAGLGINSITFKGSGNDVINQGGTDTLTDNGTNNTIALPLAGQGMDTTNGSVLANGDTFDLRAAMAATTWDQKNSDLGSYLSMGTSGSNALVQLSVTSGGTPITIAVLNGQGSVSLSSFAAHALLT